MNKISIIFVLLHLTALHFLPDQIDAKAVKAPTVSNNSIENLKEKGDFYSQHKQYEDAARIYEEIIDRKPDFYAVRYSLGVALEALERYAEAIEQLDSIPKESNLYFDALSVKGLILNGLGQNEAALDIFETLTTSVPASGSYWCNKSKVLIDMDLYEKAIEAVQAGLQVDDDNVFLLNNLGIAQFRAGYYEKALQTSKKAFELAPGNFDAVDNLASVLAQLGRYREALKYYERAAELDSTSFSALYERGYALEMCEQIDQAIECYRKATKIEPSNPGVWCRLVYILEQNEDFQDAFDTVEKALTFHPKEFYLWYARGRLALEINKSEEALKSYKTATEINPIKMAIEYALVGDLEMALHDLKEANIAPIDVIKTIETDAEYRTLLSDSLYSEKLQTFIDTLRIE